MNDQSNTVMRNAAAYLRDALPGQPGAYIGDQRFDPDKAESAFYTDAKAESPPQLGRQTVKLTLYARTALRIDKDRARLDELAGKLEAAAAAPAFADALSGSCAVLPAGGLEYMQDDTFHTAKLTYQIFIRE